MRLDFVIVTAGRTGSTTLVSLLDSHPDVRCLDEIFNPVAVEGTFAASDDDDPMSFLAARTADATEARVGFKLAWSSILAVPETAELFRRPGLTVILSTRADRLAQYLSTQLATATGTWHSRERPHERIRVRLDPAAYARWHADAVFADAVMTALSRNPVFSIDQEQLGDRDRLVALQQRLGVVPGELASDWVRLRSGPLAGWVENWDEFVAGVRATPAAATLAPHA